MDTSFEDNWKIDYCDKICFLGGLLQGADICVLQG